jgi:hypothetical protein
MCNMRTVNQFFFTFLDATNRLTVFSAEWAAFWVKGIACFVNWSIINSLWYWESLSANRIRSIWSLSSSILDDYMGRLLILSCNHDYPLKAAQWIVWQIPTAKKHERIYCDILESCNNWKNRRKLCQQKRALDHSHQMDWRLFILDKFTGS